MKRAVIIASLVCWAFLAGAGTNEYVTWIKGAGTATTNKVGIIPYWWSQFPDRDDTEGRELIFAVPFALRKTWGASKRLAFDDAIQKLLSGRVMLTRAKLPVWKSRLTNAGIPCEIVLPGQTPSFGLKVYVIVIAKGDKGANRLLKFGLEPFDTVKEIE